MVLHVTLSRQTVSVVDVKIVQVPRFVDVHTVSVQHQKHIGKYISKLHKIGGAQIQYVKTSMKGLNKKGMKTVGITDYTMQAPPSSTLPIIIQ